MFALTDAWNTSTACTLAMVVLVLFIVNVISTWLKQLKYFKSLNIPASTPLPIIGNLFSLLRNGQMKFDLESIAKYGKVFGYFEAGQPIIVCADLNILKNVLIKDFQYFVNRRTFEASSVEPLDKMITVLKDEEWKNVRSILSVAFSSGKLKQMSKSMIDCADTVMEHLDDLVKNDKQFDAKEVFGCYTLDVIGSCCFGIKTDSIKDPNSKFLKNIKMIFSQSVFKNPKILLVLFAPRLAKFLAQKAGVTFFPKQSMQFFKDISEEIIRKRRSGEERREDLIQIMVDHEDTAVDTKKETTRFHNNSEDIDYTTTTMWKPLRKTLTNGEILSQALVFYMAGYETTASTLSFIVYSLAVNQECQDKLYLEIQNAFLDHDEKVDYEMVNDIQYLDMVIQETLRLYPSAGRADRVANADCKYENYIIPKGSVFGFSIFAIHYDPEIYPDPYKFDPERFSPAEKAKRDNMSYLVFGSGPRNCIGMRFALLEIKLILCKILLKYEIVPCDKTIIPMELTSLGLTKPKEKIILKLKPRN